MYGIDSEFITSNFIKYCKINTRSDNNSNSIPTTKGQVQLAKVLEHDFNNIGIKRTSYNSDNGYLTVILDSNSDKKVPAIGFIAHLDTADFNAENINPQIHRDYNGEKLYLNKNMVLDPNQFPRLKTYKGDTLITSDGTTLLGTDDKGGIAAAITAAKHLLNHPEIKHGTIKFAFGPDEEIGRGAKRFDAKDFNTEFAYTLDNGAPGELQNETFNAAVADIDIKGVAVHPGEAYGLMVNAISIANKIVSKLPKNEVPEKRRDHNGFFLVTSFEGTIDHAHINIIIRDFDSDKYNAKIKLIKDIVSELSRYNIDLNINQQYLNIKPELDKHPESVNLAIQAYRELDMEPKLLSFRGGTDGDFITEKGIPTPNLFNGGGNYHGPYEYESVGDLTKLSETLIQISKDFYDKF